MLFRYICSTVWLFDVNKLTYLLKTAYMVFKPVCGHKVVCNKFPVFRLSGQCLQFINKFKYLDNILNNSCTDDNDIKREIRNMYARMC